MRILLKIVLILLISLTGSKISYHFFNQASDSNFPIAFVGGAITAFVIGFIINYTK